MENTRRTNWSNGVWVPGASVGFECTHPRCRENSLRLNADGVWCLEHYIKAPRCEVCGEDRPAIPAEFTEDHKKRMCRDCWQDTFEVTPVSLVMSNLGFDACEVKIC